MRVNIFSTFSPRWLNVDVHIIRLLNHTLYIMVIGTQHGKNVDDCMICSLSCKCQAINIDIAPDALRQALYTNMALSCPQSDSGQLVQRGLGMRSHAQTHTSTHDTRKVALE